MSNSNLVNYIQISPNSTNPRNAKIDKITIHHMSGNLSVETCGNVFAPASREASSNYSVATDGRVGMYVEECNRAWTSANASNDNRAVTIEVANDEIGGSWHVSDVALAKLIDLCVDICQRNGIEKLNFTGDVTGNLTMHRWFASTDCPGEYLASKFPYIAGEVNKRLGVEDSKPKPAPSPSVGQAQAPKSPQADDIINQYSENGVFYPNTAIVFRNAPNTNGNNPIQGQYENGESVNYDYVVITNKYVWISWVSASSGVRRYMPVRDRRTNELWGRIE